LDERGYRFTTHSEREIVRAMKETIPYVALDFEGELQRDAATGDRPRSYTLPDGTEMVLGDERIRCPELLFKPDLDGLECEGIHKTVVDSIMKSRIDIRKHLYGSIVLSGGSTLFTGLPARLEKEIVALAPPKTLVKVIAQPGREWSAWRGGSVLACRPAFAQIGATRRDYNESGPAIIHQKCP
jgi:actin-related protein